MDYVNDYLATANRPVAQRMRCADGTTLSVQASSLHYCTPKSDTGPWSTVEVWRVVGPSGKTVNLPSWSRDSANHMDDPYSYVPVDKVNAFIKRHGGLA